MLAGPSTGSFALQDGDVGRGFPLATFDFPGLAGAGLLDQATERVAIEADLGEKGEDGRIRGDEHGGQVSRGGRVTEAAKDFALAAAAGLQKGAASLGLVAKDPERAADISDMGSLVLDVQLPGPGRVLVQGEVVGNEVFEEEFPPSARGVKVRSQSETLLRMTVR